MNKYEKLKTALLNAIKVAKAAQLTEDGGTCNFDSPVINYTRMGYQKSKAIEVIESVGLRAWDAYGRSWKGYIIVGGVTVGQGDCRTTMAEAFADSLQKQNIESGVYYQMD